MATITKDNDYPCIRAWDRMMGSYAYYTDNQIAQARADKAPQDATFYNSEKKRWSTLKEVQNVQTQWYFQQHHPNLVKRFTDWKSE